jgi:hypothetical protein
MTITESAWSFEHSVNCAVSVEFAWQFWTDVQNWTLDSEIESVELSGPFTQGTLGATSSRSSGLIQWQIAEIGEGRAVIEFPLAGAMGRCVWSFEDFAGHTRITQAWTLQGAQAANYVESVAPGLETGIPAGMRKLCRAMEDAALAESSSTVPR